MRTLIFSVLVLMTVVSTSLKAETVPAHALGAAAGGAAVAASGLPAESTAAKFQRMVNACIEDRRSFARSSSPASGSALSSTGGSSSYYSR